MNEKLNKEKMLELLADQAIFGLSEKELLELQNLEKEFPEFKADESFEIATTAIGLSNLKIEEQMPQNLQAKILADADAYFPSTKNVKETPKAIESNVSQVQFEEPKRPFWHWLTPVFAGIGCIALLANIWITYNRNQNNTAQNPNPPIEKPKELTSTEKREKLLASAKDLVKTSWISPLKDENLKGEVIWSDEKQEGYMTFKGLAKNDVDKETYQLWIFENAELEKHPKDGGIFDINQDGEVVIPIDAKLKVKKPKAFAVTVENPGGVVVSKREKIVALGKV